MARNITNRLDTACALDAAGTTILWAAKDAASSAPSGIAEAATFNTQGVAWAFLDCVVTAATAPVEITVWSYRSAVGTWTILDSFGFAGVLTFPIGAHGVSVAVLGCDYVHVQVTDVNTTGIITVDATLSQEV
jgi:hypothetical protein